MTAFSSHNADVGLFVALAGCAEASEVLNLATDPEKTGRAA
jgi:hypothetical protein